MEVSHKGCEANLVLSVVGPIQLSVAIAQMDYLTMVKLVTFR